MLSVLLATGRHGANNSILTKDDVEVKVPGHSPVIPSRCGENNAQRLFGIEKIPAPEQIRNILDGIPVESLFGVFEKVYRALKEEGHLKKFEVWAGQLLVALDVSKYYSPKKFKCDCCFQRKSKSGEMSYSLAFVDARYQSARRQRGTRKGFFQDLVSLTKYLLFEGREHLLDFLLDEALPQFAPRRPNSS